MKLWRVTFTVRFHSSSGMQRYFKDHLHQAALVVAGDSLSSVADSIRVTLSNQQELLPFEAAECLGNVILPPGGTACKKCANDARDYIHQ